MSNFIIQFKSNIKKFSELFQQCISVFLSRCQLLVETMFNRFFKHNFFSSDMWCTRNYEIILAVPDMMTDGTPKAEITFKNFNAFF